jgi:carbamoyl-phosphate synthase large subunit
MEITFDKKRLRAYLENAFEKDTKNPVLIDKYLEGREIEVDAICDGTDVLIPGIMEHLERAGIHSGDSISMYPPQNLSQATKDRILEITKQISLALEVIGMVNIQFIEYQHEIYIIEVNPRSSRTVPYITKVTGVPVIDLATRVMLGEKLADIGYGTGLYPESRAIAVKVPVFSTEKLPMVEVSLGPEMRSTGEVLGVGYTLEEALYKGFVAAKTQIPGHGSLILATIRKRDQPEFLELAKRFYKFHCKFIATEGTGEIMMGAGIRVMTVKKISEGVPNVLDIIRSGLIDLIIDIPSKGNDINSDGFKIRRTAAESGITVMTSLDTVRALLEVMESGITAKDLEVTAIGHYE